MSLSPQDKQDLARRYAPHWKFNAQLDPAEMNKKESRQNQDEYYFPMSVDAFVQEARSGPVKTRMIGEARVREEASELYVKYPEYSFGSTSPNLKYAKDYLQSIDDLSRYAWNSPAIQKVEDLLNKCRWPDPVKDEVRLDGYPKHMIGDVKEAATYFYAYDPREKGIEGDWSGDTIIIGYYLFYPYDTAGKFRTFLFWGAQGVQGSNADGILWARIRRIGIILRRDGGVSFSRFSLL